MKQSMKPLLQDGKCHILPGVYDAMIAKICEKIGFKATGEISNGEIVMRLDL